MDKQQIRNKYAILLTWMCCSLAVLICRGQNYPSIFVLFLAALAALYLTSVTEWVNNRHFRILTQRVSFETWDPSDIWSTWCLDKKTKNKKTKKRQKDKKSKRHKNKESNVDTTERQKDIKMTKIQNDKKAKRQKWQEDKQTKNKKMKRQKDPRQRPKREFNIVTSGQFRTLAMFFHCRNVFAFHLEII